MTDERDPHGSALRWSWQTASIHRSRFAVGGVLLGVATVVGTSILASPEDPTVVQRIVNGLVGVAIASITIVLLSLLYALVIAPHQMLKERVLALEEHRAAAAPPTEVKPPQRSPELKAVMECAEEGELVRARLPQPGPFVNYPDTVRASVAQWETRFTMALAPFPNELRQFSSEIPIDTAAAMQFSEDMAYLERDLQRIKLARTIAKVLAGREQR